MKSDTYESNDEIFVCLSIFSYDINPDEISSVIGMIPDKSRYKGNVIRGDVVYKENMWEIYSTTKDTVRLDTHVQSIITRIQPFRGNFKNLDKCNIWLSCAIYVKDGPSSPSIHFDAETISFLSEINAEIDIDIYCLLET